MVNMLREANTAMEDMRKLKKHAKKMHSRGYLLAPVKKWDAEWKKQPEMYPYTISSLVVTMRERMSTKKELVEFALLQMLQLQ